jgi:hypothetical protein
MDGGTTFNFVDDGIEAALERAFDAADGKDVRLGGGVATIQQYLRAGLVDEMHLAFAPVLLGAGERLFEGPDTTRGYQCVELVTCRRPRGSRWLTFIDAGRRRAGHFHGLSGGPQRLETHVSEG